MMGSEAVEERERERGACFSFGVSSFVCPLILLTSLTNYMQSYLLFHGCLASLSPCKSSNSLIDHSSLLMRPRLA